MPTGVPSTEATFERSMFYGVGRALITQNEVTFMFLSRRLSCAAVAFLAACQSPTPTSFARPKPPSEAAMAQALGGTGYATTASFDVPVVDPNTWQGTPIGTGTWSAQSTPPQTGGTQGIGAIDSSDPTDVWRYVVVGDFTQGSGHFFSIIADVPLVVGTTSIDNQHVFAGLFDAATGQPVALADSGTITLTQADATGGRIVGSFSGSVDDVSSGPVPPACQTNADCATGPVCASNVCVQGPPPTGCTSNAQCPTGTTCQAGQCVGQTPPPPACRVDTDCLSGQSCQNGVCVAGVSPPPGCTSNSQCPTGSVCQSGLCISTQPPACQSAADCYPGATCQNGVCIGSTTPPGTCQAQGSGSVSEQHHGHAATCSAPR